jgi:hypothetical protein
MTNGPAIFIAKSAENLSSASTLPRAAALSQIKPDDRIVGLASKTANAKRGVLV